MVFTNGYAAPILQVIPKLTSVFSHLFTDLLSRSISFAPRQNLNLHLYIIVHIYVQSRTSYVMLLHLHHLRLLRHHLHPRLLHHHLLLRHYLLHHGLLDHHLRLLNHDGLLHLLLLRHKQHASGLWGQLSRWDHL